MEKLLEIKAPGDRLCLGLEVLEKMLHLMVHNGRHTFFA